MKRLAIGAIAIGLVVALGGVALAFGPGGPGRGFGYGPGWMMGGGMMRGWAAQDGSTEGWTCPGWAGAAGQGQPQVTEDQAKAAASEYVAKYFPGYSIERVLPFSGRFRTMYQVELKGPKGETRVLHVNPWGQVRPFAAGPIGS